jgi:hypothetical protein
MIPYDRFENLRARSALACLDDKRAQADRGFDCMTGVLGMKTGMPRRWLSDKRYALVSYPLTVQTVACNAPYVTLFGPVFSGQTCPLLLFRLVCITACCSTVMSR